MWVISTSTPLGSLTVLEHVDVIWVRIEEELTIWSVAPESIIQEFECGKWTALRAIPDKLLCEASLPTRFDLG